MIVWLYGQPGAGKTTIANKLAGMLMAMQIDGDSLRETLKNYDYSPKGRQLQNQSILDIARYLDSKNISVIISAVGPYKKYRDELKETNKAKLIYLYSTEVRGREDFFVKDFQPPDNECPAINTSQYTISETIDIIINRYIY